MFGRIPVMPLVSGACVVVFGGLTLFCRTITFIKIKPTIVNLLFAGALFGGLLMGRSLLKLLFGEVFRLTEEGWRKLTLRWACSSLARRPQRDRVAQVLDRHVGEFQSVRHHAADAGVRHWRRSACSSA